MKYSLNHYWKFKNLSLAFLAGWLQVSSCFVIAIVNYVVILESYDILELAKDFVALIVIAQIDDMFAQNLAT